MSVIACDEGQLGGCSDENPIACVCEDCDPAGGCDATEDCVCPDCHVDGFCSDPDNCNENGLCDPYNEGCACIDCEDHPQCAGFEPPQLVCDVGAIDGGCSDGNVETCVCEDCDPGGGCGLSEDCICNDCDFDDFCSNNCDNNGECDPYNEGCACGDCVLHPFC